MQYRLPTREIGFALSLVVSTAIFGWLSGRNTFLPDLLRPGLGAGEAVAGKLHAAANSIGDIETLKVENASLKKSLEMAETELVTLREQHAENLRLKALVGLASDSLPTGVVARAIGRNPDNWFQRVLIDRGSSSGITVDYVAVTGQGLIGKVISVGHHTAWIGLLTDPAIEVSTLNQRSRSPGVLGGQANAAPVLKYLQQQADFRVGDLLVTNGQGGVFPKGIPVGRVSKIQRPNYLIVPQVSIKPCANLESIEEVRLLAPLREPS
jgi:rod shape-determining protein MreC